MTSVERQYGENPALPAGATSQPWGPRPVLDAQAAWYPTEEHASQPISPALPQNYGFWFKVTA
jgi:hypothetical protein